MAMNRRFQNIAKNQEAVIEFLRLSEVFSYRVQSRESVHAQLKKSNTSHSNPYSSTSIAQRESLAKFLKHISYKMFFSFLRSPSKKRN